MKYFFHILIPLLVCFHISFGQFKVSPLRSDPQRQSSNTNSNNVSGFRIAGTSGITSVQKVKDTLELPFFDDFTSLAPPFNTITNDTGSTPKNIVTATTYGLHGLNNGDRIYLSGNSIDTTDAFNTDQVIGDLLLNGTWYVKRINAYTFTLYKDANLTIPFNTIIKNFPKKETPFWVKDNARHSSNPDSLKWENGGGVYINNRFGVDPPSYNVATFDGLDANGKSYSNTKIYKTGTTDTLTSLPINLSNVKPSSNLVFSFYYQRAGLGEAPDPEDSLTLQFKNKTGAWTNAPVSMVGTSDSGRFTQSFIPITDTTYFFKGFQFRFIAQGEQNGSFDVWNVDYIYLDTARTDQNHPNISIQKASISLLKTYTAMPFQQFFYGSNTTNKKDLIDSLVVTYNNLRTNGGLVGFGTNSRYSLLRYENTIFKLPENYGQPNINQSTREDICFKIDPDSITKPANKYNLKLTYSTISPNLNNLLVNGVDYRCNDTITGYTVLNDYYAYDDSSAEFASAINQSGGKMAVHFQLNVPDTLVGIDIYFPHIETEYKTMTMDLLAWSQIVPTEQQLGIASITLAYSSVNNQFKRFKFDNEIIINGTQLFVGFRQGVDYEVPIGFDKNTNSHGEMWYNVNAQWHLVNDTGSLMIRPVFKNQGNLVSGILNPQPKNHQAVLDCEVFPNPTTGILNILGEITSATLTDLSGKVLLEQTFSTQDMYKSMELQNIPAGFYLLRLANSKASAVKKIILVK